MKKIWTPLAQHVYRDLESEELLNKKFVVGFSGGADSTALVEVLSDLLDSSQLLLVHCHHGTDPENPTQSAYREEALLFCESYAKSKELRLLSVKSERGLRSEEEARNFRRDHFLKILSQEKFDFVCTAHQSEDLLETRLIKLLRGAGPEGVSAFRKKDPPFLRPFLEVSGKELRKELEFRQISYLEDPSNSSSDFLRNWIRNEWLPSLEAKSPGSVRALGRSLENMIPQVSDLTDLLSRGGWIAESKKLNLDLFLTLSKSEKERVLAFIFRSFSPGNYSVATFREVLKQLDKLQRGHTFSAGGLIWTLDELGPGRNFLRFVLRSEKSLID